MSIEFLHRLIRKVDGFSFENIRENVIEELCKGEQSAEYLQGIHDTLQVIKNMYERK